jgi:hypothetical protein
MLTDAELQAIADEYVRSLPDWEEMGIHAVRICTLHDPPGECFRSAVSIPPERTGPTAYTAAPAGALSDLFFIYRESGLVRRLELRPAWSAPPGIEFESADHIRWILAGAVPTEPTPPRPWWKFW